MESKYVVMIIVALFLGMGLIAGVIAHDEQNKRDFQVECVKSGGTVNRNGDCVK